jgi:hypothetical protein
MGTYRVIEIKDTLINDRAPFWRIEKKILGLWWTQYFEEHSEWGATFYERDKAMKWYAYHCNKNNRTIEKVIAQNK